MHLIFGLARIAIQRRVQPLDARVALEGIPVPAQVLVVFDHDPFLRPTVDALREAGHDVVGVVDPMKALAILEHPHQLELLITGMQFPTGRQNGVSLALMARQSKPEIKILFVDKPEVREHAEGVGEFMAEPMAVADIVAAANRLLSTSESGAGPTVALQLHC